MSAGDYLKVAASQLRRASVVLQEEAHDVAGHKDRTTREKSNYINKAQLQLKGKQVAAIDPNRDDQEKQRLAREAKELQQQIESEKQIIEQVAKEATQTANLKQSQAHDLESQASRLESQASAM